jgi:hypothetical protein
MRWKFLRELRLQLPGARHRRRAGGRRRRQSDNELAPLSETVAQGPHGAAVQLHQTLDQRQSDAEAAAGAFLGTLGLNERLEDPRQELGSDPRSGVFDAENHVIPVAPRDDPDPPSHLGVLDGVREQIGDDLLEANVVGEQSYGAVREVHRQHLLPLFDHQA